MSNVYKTSGKCAVGSIMEDIELYEAKYPMPSIEEDLKYYSQDAEEQFEKDFYRDLDDYHLERDRNA